MIRPLRRRHPVLIGLVGAIVVPLYFASLMVRPDPAVQDALPDELADPPEVGYGGPIVELSTTPPIQVRGRPLGTIETQAEGFVEGADLLLYWAPALAEPTVAVGWLLGSLRGGERQVFTLPDAAATTDGVLIVYSLAHGEQLATAPWPATPGNER